MGWLTFCVCIKCVPVVLIVGCEFGPEHHFSLLWIWPLEASLWHARCTARNLSYSMLFTNPFTRYWLLAQMLLQSAWIVLAHWCCSCQWQLCSKQDFSITKPNQKRPHLCKHVVLIAQYNAPVEPVRYLTEAAGGPGLTNYWRQQRGTNNKTLGLCPAFCLFSHGTQRHKKTQSAANATKNTVNCTHLRVRVESIDVRVVSWGKKEVTVNVEDMMRWFM